jgi:hypothetical protein
MASWNVRGIIISAAVKNAKVAISRGSSTLGLKGRVPTNSSKIEQNRTRTRTNSNSNTTLGLFEKFESSKILKCFIVEHKSLKHCLAA